MKSALIKQSKNGVIAVASYVKPLISMINRSQTSNENRKTTKEV